MQNLFASSLKPEWARYRKRLWFADLLDLLTGCAIGWGVFRASDLSGAGRLVLLLVAGWVAYETLSGIGGRTLWHWVVGVRVTHGERPVGLWRSFVRAFTLIPDHILLVLTGERPFDRALELKPEAEPRWRDRPLRGLLWQVPWVIALLLAIKAIVLPTRTEAIQFLVTLDGWYCCHGRMHTRLQTCNRALTRLAKDASSPDERAQKLAADCPEAQKRIAP